MNLASNSVSADYRGVAEYRYKIHELTAATARAGTDSADLGASFYYRNIRLINFDKVSTETLESLSEKFDEIIEETTHLQEADVSYGDGVLTIKFGHDYGTYVINRQIPNQQIWLSSPTSGPKRYDFINGSWIYKHDGRALHELLNEEISNIVKSSVSFDECSYSIKAK
ncbi:PREDICTED: frataxin homolog, mitochondrial [Ceratosolen solmsi marchali]|uniref:ferroxidase n=1 Tax=Ceratosolen solmsi marchali TaxID=326594 RepID=A0AAJ6YEG9_9HYME|nr:PREDICTED: frataxin homolog, mitochondrial [Ceratosolen solmsi marchali]